MNRQAGLDSTSGEDLVNEPPYDKEGTHWITFVEFTNKSELVINKEMHVGFWKAKPSWWWRLWYWILLGWKWRDVDR